MQNLCASSSTNEILPVSISVSLTIWLPVPPTSQWSSRYRPHRRVTIQFPFPTLYCVCVRLYWWTCRSEFFLLSFRYSNHSFSLSSFCTSYFFRLYPASVVTILFTLIMGFLTKSSISGMFFFSNVFFNLQANYLAPGQLNKRKKYQIQILLLSVILLVRHLWTKIRAILLHQMMLKTRSFH